MIINRIQVYFITLGALIITFVIMIPPRIDNSGLFGSTVYIPIWSKNKPYETLGVDWNVFAMQILFILEVIITLVVLFRRKPNKGQIGSACTSLLAIIVIVIGFALDFKSIFEPNITLILLNLVGFVSVITALAFGRIKAIQKN